MRTRSCISPMLPIVLLAALLITPASAAQNYAKLSPFEAVRFDRWSPLVQLDGRWYRLTSIADVPAGQIITFCRETYGINAKKRFTEDLVQVMGEMGHTLTDTVSLTVENIVTGQTIEFANVPMTRENRQRIWQANRETARRAIRLTRDAALEDLQTLDGALKDQYSYLELRGFDYAGALDALREALPESIEATTLGIELQKFLSKFGDGHTRVQDVTAMLPAGWLPCALAWSGDRIVAWNPISGMLLDDDAPFLTSIDDVEIDRWLDAAGTIIADGSPALQRSGGLSRLSHVSWLRGELELSDADDVKLTLADADGANVTSLTLPIESESVTWGRDPRTRYERLEDNIGLITIPSFSSDLDPQHVETCMDAMDRSRQTCGLIIDVRGNGGGGRRALYYLLPYFLGETEPPMVVNVAAYRLSDQFSDDHLGNRYLHRPEALHWTDGERQAIARIAPTFEPQWQPPADKFSDWHYMVVRHTAHARVYPYTKPVVILLDQDCFSATDIFLGAFKARSNVTLIGTASAGGSGRAATVRLRNSRIQVALSSMASFQPNGRLYDGHGIEPDIHVEPTVDDVLGRTDTAMQRAVSLILSDDSDE